MGVGRKNVKDEEYWQRLKRDFARGFYAHSGAYGSISVYPPGRKLIEEREREKVKKPSLVSVPGKPVVSSSGARGKLDKDK
jgi:hypothetical protein